MAVKIRLKRMGRKKAPHYRVVVADSASPRDGRFVESIGYYKPLSDPARLVLDLERVDFWVGKGATPSNTVKSLIVRAREGGDDTIAIGEVDAEERKKLAAEKVARKRAAEEAAAAKAAEEAAEAEAAAAAEAAAEAKAAEEAEAAEAEDAAESEEPAAEAEEPAAEEAAEEEAADADDAEEKKSE